MLGVQVPGKDLTIYTDSYYTRPENFSGTRTETLLYFCSKARSQETESSARKAGAKMIRKRFLQAFILGAVVASLGGIMLFPMGCSKMLPTAPVEDPIQAFRAEELWPTSRASLAGWLQTCSAEGSQEFGRRGGKLKLEAECFKKLEFKVPKDALSGSVVISVSVRLFNYFRDGELEKGFFVDFGPDALVFAKAAKLKMEIREFEANDGEILRLYWHDPSTGLWGVQQELEVTGKKKKATFNIRHFSRYAICR